MLCGKQSTALNTALALLVLPILAGSTAQIADYYSNDLSSTGVMELEDMAKDMRDFNTRMCNSTDALRYKEKCRQLSGNFQGPNVDKIKNIEMEPTQFTIITTKEGTVDSLKIHIELVDLHDNRTLPQIDLFGLFLVVTRGRYTVPFLKPNRWYGLTFISENIVNRETNVHKENRLLKTASRERNGNQEHDIYKVFMHRNLDGEESVESLYVTSKWRGVERVPKGELHTSVKIHCESSTASELMILHFDEDSVTIEISMDLRYDINYVDDSFHRVIAHIAPLKCHMVCWQNSLLSHFGSTTFSSDAAPECHNIEPTTSTTYLWEMKQYAVEKHGSGYELVVETELHEETEEGLITLSVLNLGDKNSKIHSKTFSADSSNGTLHLPLSSDTVYAVQYEYVKLKPFHFTKKKHFLVEVAPENDTELLFPLVEVNFDSENRTAKDDSLILKPFVSFTRGKLYASRDVGLHLEPFCEGTQTSAWTLSDRKPSHRLDLTSAMCTYSLAPQYCDDHGNYTKCSPVLCYSTSVVVDGDKYVSNARCLNVTHHFPLSASCSKLLIFTYLLTILRFTLCISSV